MENLRIDEFNMNKIKANSNILIIGMRASGKSTLIKDILYHKKDSNIGGIFSKTERLSSFYSDFCPLDKIYNTFNKYVIIDEMKNSTDHIINVMDDCFNIASNWTINQEIKDMTDKTHNMMNIFSIQLALKFSKEFIDSFDYLFFMHESFINNIQRLHHYVPFIDNFNDFYKIFYRITKINHYNMLVVDNTLSSCKINDRIFWYRAEVNIPKFQITNYKQTIEIYESDEDESDECDSNESYVSSNKIKVNKCDSIDSDFSTESNMTISITNDNISINKNNIIVNIKL